MASDPHYLAFIRRQDCCAPGCEGDCGPINAHHHTRGSRRRGKGQKVDDRETMPLGWRHHMDFHAASGPFKHWDKAKRIEWQDGQVELFQSLYSGNRFDEAKDAW